MSSRARIRPTHEARKAIPIAARRHPLVREVDRQLARCGLRIDEAGANATGPVPILIAVSGGPDSVALLLACAALGMRTRRSSASLAITVVHVHHHLRPSADEDAAFVCDLSQRLGFDCMIKHVHPARGKGNLAAAARKLRYQALAEAASESGAKCVLVAHHADDQLETMLMALCRGAGRRGIAGMKPIKSIEGVRVIRPLLSVSKYQCEDLCRSAGIQWRIDESNLDVTRRRARLRRDVIPVLEELWPGVACRAARNSRLLRTKRR